MMFPSDLKMEDIDCENLTFISIAFVLVKVNRWRIELNGAEDRIEGLFSKSHLIKTALIELDLLE